MTGAEDRLFNRDCADMPSAAELHGCVALESKEDVGMVLGPSGLRLNQFFAEMINNHLRDDEAQAHRQNDGESGCAVGDCCA